MKKKLKLLLVVACIILVGKLMFYILKEEHQATYKVNGYEIIESFYIKDKKHYYDIIVSDKKTNYIYTLNEKVNKKKKLINKVETYKSNNLVCIVPVYKKISEKNMYCSLDNKQVSSYYLSSTKNKDFQVVLKKASKYKIQENITSNTVKKYKRLTIYKNNIEDDYKFIIWDYKGIYIIDNKEEKYQKILSYDLYDNIMATIAGNYYVLFENTKVSGIENIYYYDLLKDKLNTFKLKEKLSKDSYINGVVGESIYVTDKREKKQYIINVEDKKIEQICGENDKCTVFSNGKLNHLSYSDFFMNYQYFDNVRVEDKVIKSEDLKKEYNYFYYQEKNKFYKALDSKKNNPILLFELDDVKEWKVLDRIILAISEDSLYLYNDKNGLNKILSSNELNYNYENIIKLWKK